jgi:hypothetical protein
MLVNTDIKSLTTGNRTNLALGRIEKKIARFEKLENSSIVVQNNPAFLGRI